MALVFFSPNKISWRGRKKMVGEYGSSQEFFTKKEMLDIAKEMSLSQIDATWTRAKIARLLLCKLGEFQPIVPPLENKQEVDEAYLRWLRDRSIVEGQWQINVDSVDHATLFYDKVHTFLDLAMWMYGVSFYRLPSPWYEFDVKKQKEDSRRPEVTPYLRALTRSRTFIFTSVKTVTFLDDLKICGRVDSDPPFIARSRICGLMKKDESREFENAMNQRGLVCWTSPTLVIPHNLIQGSRLDMSLPRMATPFSRIASLSLQEEMHDNCNFVMVVDPVNMRPIEDVLLPTMFVVLEKHFIE